MRWIPIAAMRGPTRPTARHALRGLAAGIAALLLAVAGAQAQAQAPVAPGAAAGASPASGNSVTLNFKDADIDSVVGAFGHLLNRTFVIDPRVRGKISVETPRPVSREQAYQLLQAALRVQGFAIVETGGLARVVPEADAKLQAGSVSAGRTPTGGGDRVITQIFRLQYESASNMVPVLRPLISPNNTITAYASNNSLVITDYAANLERLSRIIATLDSPSTNEVEVIPVRHAVASDIAVAVSRLLDDAARAGAGAQVDPGQRVMVMADPRLNAVMVRAASAAKVNLAKSLVARLDRPSANPGNINVVYLRNAEATRMVQVLRGVLGGSSGESTAPGAPGSTGFGGSGTAGGGAVSGMAGTAPGSTLGATPPGGPAGGAATPATTPLGSGSGQAVTIQAGGATIAADPTTNALIITAPEPVYRNLRTVIDRLDARRAQVFIESLIVEVSAERAAELGIQWQFLGRPSSGNSVIGGTNLPARGNGTNILDATSNLLGIGQGLNIGLVRSSPVPGAPAGTNAVNLGLLARALESQASGNILATPNLLTLDNEEARIIIGQNVPFVTGQFIPPTAGAATNPFQTIERRDVGTTLRVRPQVSESGTVRLAIFQEVSSVQDRTLSAGLITNRRAIESQVLVDDGQIVVLGGLIEDRIEGERQGVPGLSSLPVIGNLFRYDARKRVRTNLLVFLRPVVLRTAEDSWNVTADRYDYVRQLRGDTRLPQQTLLPEFPPSELPGMSPAPGSGSQREPASLTPEIDLRSRRPAPVNESRPSVIQTAPNEVVIPLPGGPPPMPAGPSDPPGPGGAR